MWGFIIYAYLLYDLLVAISGKLDTLVNMNQCTLPTIDSTEYVPTYTATLQPFVPSMTWHVPLIMVW